MRPRCLRTFAMLSLLLLACLSCSGAPPLQRRASAPRIADTPEHGESCDELLLHYDDTSTFKLVYRPDTGAWRRQSNRVIPDVVGSHPTPNQRIVVCLESCGGPHPGDGCTDYRDSYDVIVGVANQDLSTLTQLQSGAVGSSSEIGARQILSSGTDSIFAALSQMSEASARTMLADICGMEVYGGPVRDACARLESNIARAGTATDAGHRSAGHATHPTDAATATDTNAPTDASADACDAVVCPDEPELAASPSGTLVEAAMLNTLRAIEAGQPYRALLARVIWAMYSRRILWEAAALESQRTQTLENLIDIFQQPIHEVQRIQLRDLLARLVLPQAEDSADARLNTHGTFAVPIPTTYDAANRVGFVGRVNFQLPDYIWLVDGHLIVRLPLPEHDNLDGGVDASESLKAALRPSMEVLTEAVARTWRLSEFINDSLARLHEPRRVWDLGAFSADRLVTIEVRRHQRTLQLSNGQLELRTRDSTATRIEEVHGLDRFRIEPGLAVSTRLNPVFRVEPNAAGASVIGQGFGIDSQLLPVVFVNISFCDLDLRISPLFRMCNTGDFLSHIQWLSVIRNLGLSIGITPTPAIYRNLFVGLNLQPAPYITFSGGLHLGSWRSLPDGRQVGDPFNGSQRDLDAITRDDFGVAGYFSVTLGQDILTRLRGFNLQ